MISSIAQSKCNEESRIQFVVRALVYSQVPTPSMVLSHVFNRDIGVVILQHILPLVHRLALNRPLI